MRRRKRKKRKKKSRAPRSWRERAGQGRGSGRGTDRGREAATAVVLSSSLPPLSSRSSSRRGYTIARGLAMVEGGGDHVASIAAEASLKVLGVELCFGGAAGAQGDSMPGVQETVVRRPTVGEIFSSFQRGSRREESMIIRADQQHLRDDEAARRESMGLGESTAKLLGGGRQGGGDEPGGCGKWRARMADGGPTTTG